MTPKSNIKINFPNNCFIVIVGGKYLNMIGDVMEKVDNVTLDVGGRPLAVFLISQNYNDNINIDVDNSFDRRYSTLDFSFDREEYLDYNFDRYKSTPIMVHMIILNIYNFQYKSDRFKFQSKQRIWKVFILKFIVPVNIKGLHTN